MPDRETLIKETASRCLYGQKPTEDSIRLARESLDSGRGDEWFASALIILLGDPRSVWTDEMTEAMMDHLKKSAVLEHERLQWPFLLVWQLPPDLILKHEILRAFVYWVSMRLGVPVRMNAVLLLGKLALSGDRFAIQLLRAYLEDEDEMIRGNAKYGLDKLEGQGC